MKILIVEDETAACENLVEIIREIEPETEISGSTESITQTLRWLKNNPMPDLILMDIHLSDGSAFATGNVVFPPTILVELSGHFWNLRKHSTGLAAFHNAIGSPLRFRCVRPAAAVRVIHDPTPNREEVVG